MITDREKYAYIINELSRRAERVATIDPDKIFTSAKALFDQLVAARQSILDEWGKNHSLYSIVERSTITMDDNGKIKVNIP